MSGLIILRHSNKIANDFFEEVDDAYGIDEDGPEPTENGNVAIPRVNFQLSPLSTEQLHLLINPLQASESYGIDLYEQTINFVNSHV